ncbi:Ras- protein rsr1 [Serendipita sp. 401]|nr:Ras- protein rsr1 [Serendipita sp. 401]
MSTSTPVRDFSAVILGAGGVGKSALTLRYMRGLFNDAYDPTIEETYRRTVTLDGETSRVSTHLSFPFLPFSPNSSCFNPISWLFYISSRKYCAPTAKPRPKRISEQPELQSLSQPIPKTPWLFPHSTTR